MRHRLFGPALIALAALGATLATLPPDSAGPGVTCDELYHLHQGKRLVTALRQQRLAFFLPAQIEQNFNWRPDGPPVQAPLGYWILGGTHYLFDPAPDDPEVLSITAGRFAPAVAFAVLIFLLGAWTVRRAGPLAGTATAAATALMPRLFGHAHLAALDMLTTVFFVAAVLAAAEAVRSGRLRHFALAGMVWGLAMLVRLHGALLAPPVLVWMFWQLLRARRGDPPTAAGTGQRPSWKPATGLPCAWLAAGAATLFAGWPWLWLSPATRFVQYLSSGPIRQSLRVFYAGQVWADRDAPWHYPWVMFAVTVPVGLLLLGLLGVWGSMRRRGDASPSSLPIAEMSLVVGTMVFMLALFSLPGVPVYDGERLFLMVFPLWAIAAGVGAGWLLERPFLAARPQRAQTALALFLAFQGIGLASYAPCHLDYYNLLVGGLPGAERLGFEVTYWGDTIREPMLAEAARRSAGEAVLFAPHLAPFQATAVEIGSPSLRKAGVHLVGGDPADPATARRCRYAVIYHRRADSEGVQWILAHGAIVMEYAHGGVWLSRLIDLNATPYAEKPVFAASHRDQR